MQEGCRPLTLAATIAGRPTNQPRFATSLTTLTATRAPAGSASNATRPSGSWTHGPCEGANRAARTCCCVSLHVSHRQCASHATLCFPVGQDHAASASVAQPQGEMRRLRLAPSPFVPSVSHQRPRDALVARQHIHFAAFPPPCPPLQVFLNSTVAGVTRASDGSVQSVSVVQRTPHANYTAYSESLSRVLDDWYSSEPSPRYVKQLRTLTGKVCVGRAGSSAATPCSVSLDTHACPCPVPST